MESSISLFRIMFPWSWRSRDKPDSEEEQYHPISDDGFDDASLLRHSHLEKRSKRSKRYRALFSITIASATLLACFLAGFRLGAQHGVKSWDFDTDDIVPAVVRHALLRPGVADSFQQYTTAPFVRDEDPKLAEHPWRWTHSPQLDAFFKNNSEHGRIFLITAEDLKRMGKDPSQFAHIGKDWGYGDAIYPTRFDHTHQLHCIHSLLKMADPKNTELPGPHDLRHYEHCLWGIYDYISCHVTLDVYNFKWVEEIARPFPDHASQRQCRDMNQLEAFYNKLDVSTDARIRYMVPQEGDFIHPISEQHRQINAVPKPGDDGVLKGEEWLSERRKRFDAAWQDWKKTGKIPRTATT